MDSRNILEMLRQSWEKYNGVESVVRTKRSKTEDNDNTSRVEEGEISFCVKRKRGMEWKVHLTKNIKLYLNHYVNVNS